ncbi:MAG: hypothetical protein M4D80_35360 [Myxococcota bacterium]|nr:hypothetical protein [Myxococcota bacterium]
MSRRALTLALLAACGVEIGEPPETASEGGKGDGDGSGGGSGSGGTMALTATGFLTKIATQFCDESFRCKATYPQGATVFAQNFGATTAECYAGAIAFYTPQSVEQSITAGRVIFNPGTAKTCLDGIVYQQNCSIYWQSQQPTFPSACNTALLGTVANGGTCTNDFDCSGVTSRCDAMTKKCVAN